jgi:hypothetical protein
MKRTSSASHSASASSAIRQVNHTTPNAPITDLLAFFEAGD